jgi:virginiamycin B lyase
MPTAKIRQAGFALLFLAALMIGVSGGVPGGVPGFMLAAANEVTVYELPRGDRPHDVAPAPDGLVWYTAQRAGALGILDPETGNVEKIPLGDGSEPHGVIQGPDGNAWITDSGLNAIVRYEPSNGAVTLWTLPEDADDANLNTAAFDGDGVLWFTGQSGFYGSLDPATGEMRVFESPRGRGPYGIAATPDGEIYYASLAGDHIARIDRSTGEAHPIDPPTPEQGARRVWSDSKGMIWVSEWLSGQLSRYDPASGSWAAWKLPGNDPAAYAVYVDERDIVWVSDFRANAVLAFDPASESFVATIPASGDGDGDVRQILGRAGEVWLPESNLDRLVRVRTSPE